MKTITQFIKRHELALWGLLALVYYLFLACFRYTWVFESGDSGDWLASAKLWYVPQPFGSPLYIMLAHVVGLLKGSLAANMTVWLSVIPSCITVMLIYKIAGGVTRNKDYARIVALVVLGAGVLTSQSVVVEEYALAVMLVTAFLYMQMTSRFTLSMVFLGLASAVHIIVFPIAFIFFFVNARHGQWRYWGKKQLPVYLSFAVLPYTLILVLMALDTPRWIAGNLSIQAINSWLGSTSTIGKLSFAEAPQRILALVAVVAATFGVAIIPAVRYVVRTRKNEFTQFLFLSVIFVWWLYLTNLDFTTWTFTIYSVPFVALLVVLGLKEVSNRNIKLVVGVTCVLVALNVGLLNARMLDFKNPTGTEFYNETMSLPDGSYILTSKGGFYTLGILHAIADGKNVIPIFLSEPKTDKDYGYQSWLKWVQEKYGVVGNTSTEIVENATVPVFYVDTSYMLNWKLVYNLGDYSDFYKKVAGVR